MAEAMAEVETEVEADPGEAAGGKARALGELVQKFRSWWDGEDFEDEPAPVAEVAAGPPAADDDDELEDTWSEDRLGVVEGLWGEGYSSPGEEQHILGLVKPLGLNEKMTVLDINPGLGGSSRVIATETGSWVTGLESDRDLAAGGMERSVMAGLAKKAPIKSYEPPDFGIRSGTADAVFSKEAIFAIPKREGLFDEIFKALKPVGQILFTDYVLTEENPSEPAIADWLAHEIPKPNPWTLDQTTGRLKNIGFDVRITEDISDRIRTMALTGWRDYLSTLKPGGLSRRQGKAVLAEVEFWHRRLTALDTGKLACYRFFALKRDTEVK